MYTDPDTGEIVNGVKKVSYTHDAMIDCMIAQPGVSQGELAAHFGYSQAWVSLMINSDAFQAKLAERRKELVDPAIVQTIEERFKAVAQLSLDKVLDKLSLPANMIGDDFLINSAKLASAALGYGARPQGGGGGGPAVVINLPGVAPDSKSWADRYAQEVVELPKPEPVKATIQIDHENPVIIQR